MERAVYFLYLIFAKVICALPIGVGFRAGRALGALGYWILPPYRRLVIRNLEIAFSESGEKSDEKNPRKSKKEICKLAREHFQTLTANLFSSIKTATLSREEIDARVTIENVETVRAEIAKGKGVVLLISHIGNWELFAQIAHYGGDCASATVYQALGNRFIDAAFRKDRARNGVQLFERKSGFNVPMKFLREGGLLAVLCDQHAGDGGIWTPLFGRLASTSPLAATLAARTGAAIVPVAIYTDSAARWRVVVSPTIELANREVSAVTAEINQTLERQIRQSPADWFWVHNRWKTPEPKFLLANYKRGIHYPDGFSANDLKPFRVLIRSSNWLGDAVMTVPAVRAIKRGRPDAHVTILTKAKLADFWKIVREVDDVIAISEDENVFKVAKKIRATQKFDVAILLPNSIRVALEVWLAKIPKRVGYRAKWRSALLNGIVREKKKTGPPKHQAHHYLHIAKFIGANIENALSDSAHFANSELSSAEQTSPTSPLAKSKTNPPDSKIKIGLCAGAEYGSAKRWLPERFAEAALAVSEKRACEWLLFGTQADFAISEQIEKALGENCTNLVGKTTLAELIEHLANCELLLTNDTGTMHLAAHLGVPTVSIFGSTEPALTGPLDPTGTHHKVIRHHVECSPCFLRECPIDFRCMNAITAEEVVAVVLEKLRG